MVLAIGALVAVSGVSFGDGTELAIGGAGLMLLAAWHRVNEPKITSTGPLGVSPRSE
jgi:hypothetical protein